MVAGAGDGYGRFAAGHRGSSQARLVLSQARLVSTLNN